MNALTHRAFDAIIAQIARKATDECTAYAEIDGQEREISAFYTREIDWFGGINSAHECCEVTNYRLIGAWYEDPDTGAVWAGDRAELAALIGEDATDALDFHK
jgi:hypothetical protein